MDARLILGGLHARFPGGLWAHSDPLLNKPFYPNGLVVGILTCHQSEGLGFKSQCVHFGHPSAGGCQRSTGDPRLILGKGYRLVVLGGYGRTDPLLNKLFYPNGLVTGIMTCCQSGLRRVHLGEWSRVRIPVYAHVGRCLCAQSWASQCGGVSSREVLVASDAVHEMMHGGSADDILKVPTGDGRPTLGFDAAAFAESPTHTQYQHLLWQHPQNQHSQHQHSFHLHTHQHHHLLHDYGHLRVVRAHQRGQTSVIAVGSATAVKVDEVGIWGKAHPSDKEDYYTSGGGDVVKVGLNHNGTSLKEIDKEVKGVHGEESITSKREEVRRVQGEIHVGSCLAS
ncbi:unnamed protein product [Closterium sp. NIES-54]